MTSKPFLNAPKVIFLSGLIAGTLDLTAACVSAWLRNGATPLRVSQFIASGAIGTVAFTGGYKSAVLGVALHYLIATTAAAVFYLASRKLRFLIKWPVPMGLLYGVFVYLFMYFVVLLRSAITPAWVLTQSSSRVLLSLVTIFLY